MWVVMLVDGEDLLLMVFDKDYYVCLVVVCRLLVLLFGWMFDDEEVEV